MVRRRSLQSAVSPPLSKARPFFFSLGSVLLITAFRFFLNPYFQDNALLSLYTIAVLLSAWYGGMKAGIATVVLSVMVETLFFSQLYTKTFSDILSLTLHILIFTTEGMIISFISQLRNTFEVEREEMLLSERIARRNAEQQARIREHFISVASHELKSPITSQKAFIQLLKRTMTDDTYLPLLIRIEAQTDKITSFINDLLDVSKMRSNKLQYHFSLIDINECIREIVETNQNLFVTHKIVIKGKIRSRMYADKTRLGQVITNLLSNATKYSPDADSIIISLSEKRTTVLIRIQDFGIGISPENKKKIFKRFFRVTGADESTFQGLGLGLYLTAQIIKRHKGTISVTSTLGKGSIFSISLPKRLVTGDIILSEAVS